MQMFDMNGDNVITLDELHTVIEDKVASEVAKYKQEASDYLDQAAVDWEKELKESYGQAFTYTDTDGDGAVTMEELVACFQAQGYALAQAHAKYGKMHLRLDMNKLARSNKKARSGKHWDFKWQNSRLRIKSKKIQYF